jgi:Leucine-rich repeat (LRR) protein
VSGNRLARLPENLGDCSSLEALYLNANKQLKQLPDSICRLSRLRELCANRCGISALPRDLLQLTQLDVLDLRPDLKKPVSVNLGCTSDGGG